MTPRNADEADSSSSSRKTTMAVCSLHMGRAAPLPHGRHCIQLQRQTLLRETQAIPSSSIEEHASRTTTTTPIFGCIIASLNQWGASCCRCACCSCISCCSVVAVAPIHDSVGLHCQRRLCRLHRHLRSPSTQATLHRHRHRHRHLHVPMSPSLVSMSVAVVVNICHDLIVKRSHVSAMALLPSEWLPPPFWKSTWESPSQKSPHSQLQQQQSLGCNYFGRYPIKKGFLKTLIMIFFFQIFY